MTYNPLAQDNSILHQIREGMQVISADEVEVGSVEGLFFGASSEEIEARDQAPDSLMELIGELFDPDELPEPLRKRLLQHGFIRVDCSLLFDDDCFVMPEQIARVEGERVILAISKDELIEEGERYEG